MGEVVPTLLPPSPRTVLSLSCFKVSQCINCRDWHFKSKVTKCDVVSNASLYNYMYMHLAHMSSSTILRSDATIFEYQFY